MDLSTQGVDLLAAYISGLSVLSVYHMFLLQNWVERCAAVETSSAMVIATTTTDDVSRLRAKMECTSALRKYPVLQMLGLLTAIIAIGVLGLQVAVKVEKVPVAYTAGPIWVILLIVPTVTIASTWRSVRSLRMSKKAL